MNSWKDPPIPSDRKRCPDCGETKPLEQFCRNKRSRDGHATYCKPCHNARGKDTVQRLYGGHRHYRLRDRYGIGAEEVATLIKEQGGLCAICVARPATQVDHNHRNGLVRKILCDGCNGALASFDEDAEIIARAIRYLEA